jgi:asparagine synthase (glutamine-hydrolysing)
MCGFTGYFASSGQVPSSAMRAALDAIAHRGPDDEGINYFETANGTLCLAHRRLSIIDLSANGHQPFIDGSGQYSMVYNGEVYNYRELRTELEQLGHKFRTDTDTEVVLEAWKAWGKDAWKRFIGMFSLVVYDSQNEKLVLVRDAFGIKPLYYSLTQEGIFFASEIPAIQALYPAKLSLNEHRAFSFLVWSHYDFGEQTFYNEINQLLPAHCVTYDLTQHQLEKTERWWWPAIEENKNITFDEAAAQLRSMFLNTVRLHLRSDVPLGVALSGGVDSSAVTCAIRHAEPEMPLKTFSFIAKESALSEEHWVDIVNAQTAASSAKVYVKPEEIVTDLEDLVRTLGEPFGSTSIFAQYRVFKLVKEQGVTVTLDGQGADELLAGYWGYPHDRLRSLLAEGKWVSVLAFLYHWGNWPGRSRKQALGILFQELLPTKWKFRLKASKNDLVPAWLKTESLPDRPENLARPLFTEQAIPKNRQLAHALRVDLINGGLQSLLRHGDRNAMRWSVESRVPFLTIPLVEFVLSLPETYLISPKGETKSVFKAAMRGIVPDAILDRRDKIGFSTPEGAWLRQMDAAQWIKPELIRSLPFVHADALINHLEAQFSGKTPWQAQSWRILNFLKWYEINFQQ